MNKKYYFNKKRNLKSKNIHDYNSLDEAKKILPKLIINTSVNSQNKLDIKSNIFKKILISKKNECLHFKQNINDFDINMFVTMLNIDNDILYLANSFPHKLIEEINKNDIKSQNKKLNDYPTHYLNTRNENHYSSHNLSILSKIVRISQYNNLSDKKKNLYINNSSEKSFIGYNFPFFTNEEFKKNIFIEKYKNNNNSLFFKLVFSETIGINQNTNFIDIGFIELLSNTENKIMEINKLYIFKSFRKIENFNLKIHRLIFDKIYSDFPFIQKILIKTHNKLEKFKDTITKLGFKLIKCISERRSIIFQIFIKKKQTKILNL